MRKTLTRRITMAAALALGAGLSTTDAAFADFPERAITLVIPFAAGGSTDVVGRIVAERMGQELGQNVIVQNVGGAGGNLGAQQVAKSEADGYTILMGTVATHALNPLILKQKPYDPITDFDPISLLVVVPNVLAVHPDLPVNSVQELVELAKKEPLTFASSGNGTPLHLSGALFNSIAGIDILHIPYKGSGPALTDVLGNQVPIIFDNLPSSSGHIRSGKLRALGVTTAERAASFPDIPAIGEALPGYETYTWNALFAPAGTPPEALDKLATAARAAMQDPKVAEQMAGFSATIIASTPQELAEHVKAEMAKWEPVVKEANVSLD
jgi:tripartite-type tricarboxylate transporter receptor subunit TctC